MSRRREFDYKLFRLVLCYGKLQCVHLTVQLTSRCFVTVGFHATFEWLSLDHTLRPSSEKMVHLLWNPLICCLRYLRSVTPSSFSNMRLLKFACGPIMHDSINLCFPTLHIYQPEYSPGKCEKSL